MNNKKILDEKLIISIAKKLSLDIKKFELDMESVMLKERLVLNKKIADDFMVRGTPTFVYEGKIFAGAYDFEKLKSIVSSRKN